MDDCQLWLQTKIPKRKENKTPPVLESIWMLSKWPSEIVHARAARLSCRRFRQECMCMECASLRRWVHVPWSVISLALHNCKFSNSRTTQRPQLRSESSRSPPVLTKAISMLPKTLGTLENS